MQLDWNDIKQNFTRFDPWLNLNVFFYGTEEVYLERQICIWFYTCLDERSRLQALSLTRYGQTLNITFSVPGDKTKSKFQFLPPNFIILTLITPSSNFLSTLPHLVKIVPIFTPSIFFRDSIDDSDHQVNVACHVDHLWRDWSHGWHKADLATQCLVVHYVLSGKMFP
jgi:hypothetical protein